MDIAFEHLATLVALADEGTFEAAARRLHVTPSAISQRVRAAELSAGQVLVQRTNPVGMTPAGKTLLHFARQVDLLYRDAERDLRLDTDGKTQTVRLAVNADSLNTWFLQALLPVATLGGVVFDLHRADQKKTTTLLRSASVVAAVSSASEAVQGCTSLPIGVMRYRAVCSTAFADRWLGRSRSLSSLGMAPVVLLDRDDDLQHRFNASAVGGALTSPRHYIPTSADFASAVRLGYGWGLLPEQQCLTDVETGALIELEAAHPVDVNLYWQRWNLASTLLDSVSEAVIAGARAALRAL